MAGCQPRVLDCSGKGTRRIAMLHQHHCSAAVLQKGLSGRTSTLQTAYVLNPAAVLGLAWPLRCVALHAAVQAVLGPHWALSSAAVLVFPSCAAAPQGSSHAHNV